MNSSISKTEETVKLQKVNLREIFNDVGNTFLDMTLKACTIKAKIDKQDYVKQNKLLHSKGNHQKSQEISCRLG